MRASAPLTNGWVALFGATAADTTGYVLASLLESYPLPPISIETWSWHKDASFAGRGAVIWTAVLRNNTSEYVRSIPVEVTAFDSAGNVMDTDFSYATGLAPGGTASVKGLRDVLWIRAECVYQD